MASPLLLGIALGNLVIQGRPIIFRQSRIGKDFKPFIIYKFRTMMVENPKRFKKEVFKNYTEKSNFYAKGAYNYLRDIIKNRNGKTSD